MNLGSTLPCGSARHGVTHRIGASSHRRRLGWQSGRTHAGRGRDVAAQAFQAWQLGEGERRELVRDVERPILAPHRTRALRVGEYRVTARDEGYWGDDARGATGTIRVLYADEARRLYHLDGRYQRGIWPAIEGQLLVLLESQGMDARVLRSVRNGAERSADLIDQAVSSQRSRLRAGDLEKASARSMELGEVLADLHREMLRVSLSRLNASGHEPSR